MFGFRKRKKAKVLIPEEYVEICEVLQSFEINPSEKKPSGFIAKFKRFFKLAHIWARKNVVAVAAAVAVAAVAAAVIAVAAVAAAVIAVATAAVVAAIAGKSEEKCNSIFFYIFLSECILITIAAPFISDFSILPPLIASLVLLGSYFVSGIKGLIDDARGNNVVTEFPTNLQDLQKLISLRAEAFVERHRERALAADSELAKRISKLESNLEKTKTLIIEAELMIESEDKEFALSILQKLHATEERIQSSINEMDVGKEEILEKLRIFKAHLPVFNRIYRRISITEEAASLSEEISLMAEENCAFLKRELESLNEDGLAIASIIKRVCLLSVREAPVSQAIEEGEAIGIASVKAVEALTA